MRSRGIWEVGLQPRADRNDHEAMRRKQERVPVDRVVALRVGLQSNFDASVLKICQWKAAIDFCCRGFGGLGVRRVSIFSSGYLNSK